MKKALFLILFLALASMGIGQNLTVTVPVVTANIGDAVYIPVKLAGASSTGTPISSANIIITFDTAVVEYDTLTNFYAPMPQNQWYFFGNNQIGQVAANWLEPSLLTKAVPDNTTLYEIKFIKKAGSTPLTFITYEFTDAMYNFIPTTPVHGAINAPVFYRNVTFKVDMSRENISSAGVYLAGSFNNWSTTQNPMVLSPNSIYTTTVSLQEGQSYQYRFVNGNVASGMETVPASCGIPNGSGVYERNLLIPDNDTILSPVCFSMCGECPVDVTVTFRVDVQHLAVSPEGIHVAGTFNQWNYAQSLMTQTSPFLYEFSQTFTEGDYHEFLFANGFTSAGAENPPAACTAAGHRYLTIPDHDTVLTAYCFDSCVACGTVPQFSDVTFRVDMANWDSIAISGVHVAGNFQGWLPGATAMQTTGDSVFTYTESFLVGTSLEYKFVNGITESGYEVVPLVCSVNGNRGFTVPDHDTTLIAVCFSTCDTCTNYNATGDLSEAGSGYLTFIPNPASQHTTVKFGNNSSGHISISLHDITGRQIAMLYDGFCQTGNHAVAVETTGFRSGLYFARMSMEGKQTKAIIQKFIVAH